MESTLNLSVTDLTGEVGSFLGWGRDATRWTANKAKDVQECVASCLRKFYFQAILDPRDSSHNWTFIKPVADIPLVTGSQNAALPDDFGGFEGQISVSQTGVSGGFWPLRLTSEESIRVQYAAFPSISGRPVSAAEEQIKGTSPQRSNRSRLLIYPLPDHDYVLHVPYYILPDYLTIANPYPYGGAAHAETMKAGARAAAELFLDNLPGPENGNYMQCLAASIQYDRRHQPKSLGVNSDMSDWLNSDRVGRWPEGLWHPLGIGFLGQSTYS